MPTDWSTFTADRFKNMKGSAIRELLKVTADPEIISFAGGLPAPETFPVEAIAVACERILRTKSQQALQYGVTEGYVPLREQIAAMYRARGVPATVDNVLITTGSQQGLDLIGKTIVNDNDLIVTEKPTYVGGLQAWRPFGPIFRGVQMDDDGMIIDQIDTSRPVKLLYQLPNFQNPSGVSLSEARRAQVVELARRENFLIVEDDPYRELRYSGHDVPGLVEIEGKMLGPKWDSEGHVIHLGTFSKIMAPGLRIGWTLASTSAIRLFALAKQGTDLHSSTFSMLIADELLREGDIAANMPSLRSIYRERRDVMLQSLDKYLNGRATWTRPDGGLFLWVKLHGGINTAELLADALNRKVAFVAGSAFYFDGGGTDAMRLNFSNMPPERIREGVRRLGELLQERQPAVGV